MKAEREMREQQLEDRKIELRKAVAMEDAVKSMDRIFYALMVLAGVIVGCAIII